ncbi:MAG: hypothetical protein EA381_16640 [Planctomycetaceae bacterium]|nr:MAG: hypothetical protein EA381_16640 [Planctomycetaceae bacterium]
MDLSMSAVNEADLPRVRADHPSMRITTIPPEEIVKRHLGVARALARISTGEMGEKLRAAI